MDCAKNGVVFQTAKMGTKHHSRIIPSVTSKGLHFYTEFTAHTIFKSEKVQTVFPFEQTPGREENTRALLLGWEDESVLSSKANPGCILSETECAQICCVLGFHYSSLQTHPQLTANTVPHPRCSSTVWLPRGALSPGAIASDLLSSCILYHLAAHR